MAETPPAKAPTGNAPTGPKVSGTRTLVSLVVLAIVLVVCTIELRAGLGHFLTLKSYNKVSENNLFKNITYDQANGMVAAFPSKSEPKKGEFEDTHRYYWYSLLRPLMGKSSPEVFITVDHAEPMNAVSFYTSTEGEMETVPFDPNAAPPAPTMGMGGMPGMGGGHGGEGSGMGGGGMGGPRRPRGGDQKGDRPAMEGESETNVAEPAKPDAEPADAVVEPTAPKADAPLEPATEDAKVDAPAEPK